MTKIAPAFASLVLVLSGSAALAQTDAATTVTTTSAAPAADPVGISAREGIYLSGTEVMVTRNGVTERLQKEMSLPNGLRVQPNGTIVTADGGTLALRAGQILSFDGKFSPPGGAAQPASTTTIVTPAAPVTTTTTTSAALPASPAAPAVSAATANEISAKEAERRAKAAGENSVK